MCTCHIWSLQPKKWGEKKIIKNERISEEKCTGKQKTQNTQRSVQKQCGNGIVVVFPLSVCLWFLFRLWVCAWHMQPLASACCFFFIPFHAAFRLPVLFCLWIHFRIYYRPTTHIHRTRIYLKLSSIHCCYCCYCTLLQIVVLCGVRHKFTLKFFSLVVTFLYFLVVVVVALEF